ncbi:hypothetical protein [Streptomyces tibetensis]|uniref:hypothetical protein n=1 Tax=Streptomyces tibetensis TaxID=2382123 RepID=UPI0033CEFBF6
MFQSGPKGDDGIRTDAPGERGTERLLFAVDYPYESTAEAVDFLRTAPFSPADPERIAHGNAEGLLNL